ncbi:hypothetical protein JKP88DRAFT_197745 [Tribonema minus]|uniref:RXYLT1 C-terminal domain-containing protein n=1 Tax=Tribonema minus TaxID=303371 RepID=A0A835Z7M1_9STRA|nr:hypothetical protein JKP88DRAFT_197745 [Tribonema minus]
MGQVLAGQAGEHVLPAEHILLRSAAAALVPHKPLVWDAIYARGGSLEGIVSFTCDSDGANVWERIAEASRHPWHSRQPLHRTFAGAEGATLVVRLHNVGNLCSVLNHGRVFEPAPAPGTKVVLVGDFNDNIGTFSTHIPDRTVNWGNLTAQVEERFVGMEGVSALLDDTRLLLWAIQQQQIAPPAPHPKLLSLPLGLPNAGSAGALWHTYHRFLAHGDGCEQLPPRSVLLTINNSGWQHRAMVNAVVNATFGGTLVNSYGSGRPYWDILLESKFVLSPSGMGYDCYRQWEALAHGAIPVVESSPGLDRTYAGLPVLIVADWTDVTPELLESVWHEYTVERAAEWDFNRLTEGYWLDLLADAAAAGSIDSVTERHPLYSDVRRSATARRLL